MASGSASGNVERIALPRPEAARPSPDAAPFLIEANKSRIVAAVEAELERAIENQAACEGLNVGQRQSVMSSTAQLVESVHYVHYFAQVLRVHRGGQRVCHPVQAVDRRRNYLVQLAPRDCDDLLDRSEMFEFVGDSQKLVRGRIAYQPADEDLAFAFADAVLPDIGDPLPRTRAGSDHVIGAPHLRCTD